MRLAVMQPYFFPYLGYFQLIAASDVFVFYDSAQYIKNGWSNRNRILLKGKPHWLTRPVESGPSTASFTGRNFGPVGKLPQMVREAYARAPEFANAWPIIEESLSLEPASVADINIRVIERLCAYVGIERAFRRSSELGALSGTAQEKIISLSRSLGATEYVNMAGGAALYEAEEFGAAGIELQFLQAGLSPYDQFGGPFEAGLSIIDVLMFNSRDRIRTMLDDYRLN